MEMKETYIVITFNEDGPYFKILTKQELEKNLNENYYGENVNFLTNIPNEWRSIYNGIIIIKGDIIQPKPVTKITEYKI